MHSPEHFTPDPNKVSLPDTYRLSPGYHGYFSGYHHDLHREIIRALHPHPGDEVAGRQFPIGLSLKHTDGSDHFAYLEQDNSLPNDTVIAPVWFSPPLDTSLFAISSLANASQNSEHNKPFTTRFIALFPYAELRQDRNTPTHKRRYWQQAAWEANTSQILANALISNGATEAMFLDPHSHYALEHFSQIPTLSLTATPLFAQWLIDTNQIRDHMAVIALDKGSIQRNWHLANILRRRTNCQIDLVIFDKHRPEANKVGNHQLIFGDPQGKTAILLDDLLASGQSLGSANTLLSKHGCTQAIAAITHVVLCDNWLQNLDNCFSSGPIRHLVTTDSLPQAETLKVTNSSSSSVIPIASTLAFFGKQVAASSIAEVTNNPQFSDFILTPQDPDQVLHQLQNS